MSPESIHSIINLSDASELDLDSELELASSLDSQFLIRETEDSVSSEEKAPADSVEPPSRKRWLWGLILLAGLGGISWLVYTRLIAPSSATQRPGGGPLPVTVADPTVAAVQDRADYIATLESRGSVTVQPQATGRISQIFVKSGDRIQAGQPLLRLDAEEQQAEVTGSQASIDAANAEIVAAQADLESARRSSQMFRSTLASRQADLKFKQQEYDRFKTLQAKGAASLQTLQARKNELDQAQASVSEMRAQISAQDAAIARAQANVVRSQQQKDEAIATANQAQVQLSYFTVNAPIDGIVGDIPAKVGDLVNESSNLLTLTKNQALEVNIEVPQETVSRLTLGTPVQLLDAENNVLKNGTVSYIAPNVTSQTQSIEVKARFNNTGGQLRTNQLIKARLILAKRQGVLVPTTAISRLAGKNFVFLAQPYSASSCSQQANGSNPNSKPPAPDQWVAVQKAVELGSIVNNSQEIAQGLSASDRIITSGLLQLQNCMPVQPTS